VAAQACLQYFPAAGFAAPAGGCTYDGPPQGTTGEVTEPHDVVDALRAPVLVLSPGGAANRRPQRGARQGGCRCLMK
jgi:hypothetical protein